MFCAGKKDITILKSAIQVQRDLEEEYIRKLEINDEAIPDPFQLDNWLEEEEGRVFWPMTLYPNIFNFLRFNPTELGSKDLNDYKTSKGHEYYAKGWLGELQYHGISSESRYCFLRGIVGSLRS